MSENVINVRRTLKLCLWYMYIILFTKCWWFVDDGYINNVFLNSTPRKISSNNKRAQRALGRSPEEKVKGHSGAYNSVI